MANSLLRTSAGRPVSAPARSRCDRPEPATGHTTHRTSAGTHPSSERAPRRASIPRKQTRCGARLRTPPTAMRWDPRARSSGRCPVGRPGGLADAAAPPTGPYLAADSSVMYVPTASTRSRRTAHLAQAGCGPRRGDVVVLRSRRCAAPATDGAGDGGTAWRLLAGRAPGPPPAGLRFFLARSEWRAAVATVVGLGLALGAAHGAVDAVRRRRPPECPPVAVAGDRTLTRAGPRSAPSRAAARTGSARRSTGVLLAADDCRSPQEFADDDLAGLGDRIAEPRSPPVWPGAVIGSRDLRTGSGGWRGAGWSRDAAAPVDVSR